MHHVALDEGSLFAVRNSVGIASDWLWCWCWCWAVAWELAPPWRTRTRLPATQVWSPRRPLNRPRHPLWFAANTRAGGSTGGAGPAVGQNPTPFTGTAPFGTPNFVPKGGATVGVGQPIIINFPGHVEDAGAAIDAVHVSSVPPVSGKFYWMTPTQLRWRPLSFWPAHTAVTVDAGGTVSGFQTGDSLIATADDSTHQLTITRNGVVEKTFRCRWVCRPAITKPQRHLLRPREDALGGDGFLDLRGPSQLDLWLQGDSRPGRAVRHVGDFVHSAPWSVDDQGKRDVSHGCINISPSNAQWFFDNFGAGDPIVVKNSSGGSYTKNDGSNDWQN